MVMPLISTHARELGASPTMTGLVGIFKHSQSISKSFLADVTASDRQSAVLGHFNAASSIGFILGPMIGGNLAETSNGFMKVALLTASIFVINSIMIHFTMKDNKSSPHPEITRNESSASLKKITSEEINFNPLDLFRSFTTFNWSSMWDLFLIKFCLGFSVILFRSNFSLLMKTRFDVSPSMLGYFISYSGIVSAVCGIFVGWLSKYYKNDAKLVYHMAILQFFTLLFLSSISSLWIFFLVLTPLSFITTVLRVAATSLTVQRGSGKEIGALLGLSQSVMSLARMLSPFISGLSLEVSTSGPALLGAMVTSIAVIIMTVRSQEPKEKSA
ncbi:hypothetical protein FSP39_023907 [Pinctada imbricata]|uniref:Major facilitator superfamily (MFS) profile domain-containing protein n=1 Tax=Pinctada imbricata TaxID=66713 RepID=A0AA88YBM4_PINIB|nr:hypothetical protein FSP39_023907 [Pinctada imbricata]